MKPVNPFLPCGAFDDDLKAYHDGELNFLKRWQVRSHLAKCPQCQGELKLMQTIEKELTSEAMAPIESDLRAKILEGLPVEAPVQHVSKPAVHSSTPYLTYTAAFGVLLFIGAGFLSMSSMSGGGSSDMSDSTAGTDPAPMASFQSRGVASSSTAGSAPMAAAPALPITKDSASDSARALNDERIKALNTNRSQLQKIQQEKDTNASRLTPYSNLPDSQPQRSVHKEGSLTVAVDNSETSGSAVETLVKRSGGFVASNALSTGVGGMRSATMDLRIPVDSFESIVSKIGALGTVRAKSINGQDVTAQVAVTRARKETLSDQLSMAQARLREIAKKYKPGSEEVAESRAEVRSLSLQAAQAKAELDTIHKFAALSTLYVTLQDKGKAPTPASFSGSLNETGTQAWNSFLNTARLPIQLVIWILAYSPLWLPAWIIWRKFGRKLVA